MVRLADALETVRSLGDVAELQAATQLMATPARSKVNAHIHLPPNFSAFTTVGQAVEMAAAQDVKVLGVSNYYDFGVYRPFARLAQEKGIFPLFGLEIICMVDNLRRSGVKINDPGNPGKMYVCGKGITRFDPLSATARDLLATIRQNDATRMASMIDRIAAHCESRGLKTGVTEDMVIAMVMRRHDMPREMVYLQERHVAQAFQEALCALVPAGERSAVLSRILGVASKAGPEDTGVMQNEIRAHLMKAGKPGYVEETFVDFEHAYHLVLALGGIPCYPILADGTTPLCEFEDPVEKLAASLRERRIYCVELIPNRNAPDVLDRYVRALRSAGMIVLGGTEHNTLDMAPMEPTCAAGAAMPSDARELFWEGACVVAAHEFLTAHGEIGYVDTHGILNSAYESDAERIAALARLGAAVLETYFRLE